MGDHRHARPAAFTLVELLVVMAVMSVLAALLMPAIASGREKARRSACAANLSQVGRAVGAYTADFKGYLPSWTAWPGGGPPNGWTWCRKDYPTNAVPAYDATCNVGGAHNSWVPARRPQEGNDFHFAARPSDRRIRSNNNYITNWRVIGTGVKTTAAIPSHAPGIPTHPGSATWNRGELNCAPQGLGQLLFTEYITDAAAFYCPSAMGMPTDMDGYFNVLGINNWAALGGRDRNALMYGDYRTFKVDSGSQSFVGILSSYNWRNTPLGIWSSWHKYQDGTFHLPGVRPRTFVRTLQPYFRTQRELGDRALVCDTFSKGCAYDGLGRRVVPDICPTNYSEPIAKSREVAGFGFKHHREGYFVLYGDGRAQWFGDPDRKIIWHTQGQDTRSFVGAWYVTELCNNYFYGSNFGNTTGYTIEQYYQCHGPNDVWHQMDVAAGVDVNVKYW